MAGNVKELVSDWFDGHYYASSPRRNPTGPASSSLRVDRGGDWANGHAMFIRAWGATPGPAITSMALPLSGLVFGARAPRVELHQPGKLS